MKSYKFNGIWYHDCQFALQFDDKTVVVDNVYDAIDTIKKRYKLLNHSNLSSKEGKLYKITLTENDCIRTIIVLYDNIFDITAQSIEKIEEILLPVKAEFEMKREALFVETYRFYDADMAKEFFKIHRPFYCVIWDGNKKAYDSTYTCEGTFEAEQNDTYRYYMTLVINREYFEFKTTLLNAFKFLSACYEKDQNENVFPAIWEQNLKSEINERYCLWSDEDETLDDSEEGKATRRKVLQGIVESLECDLSMGIADPVHDRTSEFCKRFGDDYQPGMYDADF